MFGHWVWKDTSVMLPLGSRTQEDKEFEGSLSYVRPGPHPQKHDTFHLGLPFVNSVNLGVMCV